MTTEADLPTDKPFVTERLPWVIAGAALVVFLVTLNRWVSVGSIGVVGRLSGWLWQAELNAPLYWLLTAPLHWLPAPAIPVALNVFSAVCAALTLALLARSVALLPHDRTEAQRVRERSPLALLSIPAAWVPPVAAVVVCGLQLSFWENSTAASNEMLDLLVLAYAIRCVLEYRLDENVSWLTRASFVYAMGMASSWVMVGLFPLFLVALVWSRRLSFFDPQFLTRMFLFGVLGLLLYLLLPLLQSRADIATVPFWVGLKSALGGQKEILLALYLNAKHMLALLSLTSLVPLLVIALRWPSRFGDRSQLGSSLASFTFHVVHGLLLVACLWVSLDPPVSPRNMGMGLTFLCLYYLAALSVGYFAGYFLLIFGSTPSARVARARSSSEPLVNKAVIAGVCLLLVAAPLGLLYRNLPQILVSNGPMLRQFAALTSQALPPKGAVVLSDDYRRLLLCESAATQDGTSQDTLFVDTSSLAWPAYHRFLRHKYGERWPVDMPRTQQSKIDGVALIALVSKLAETHPVFYLHPSFGYYFEAFYLEPHGMVYQLKPYATNQLTALPLSDDLLRFNEDFWAKAIKSVLPTIQGALAPGAEERPKGLLASVMKAARLQPIANRDATVLASYYSRGLDYWGVEQQRLGHLPEAGADFALAHALNPDNIPAAINQQCNQNLQAARRSSVDLSKSMEEEFGRYHNWDQLIGDNGPFDEPTFCYEQGRVLAGGGNYRQAAQQFARVRALAPENLAARLWLAQLHILGRMPAEAVRIVQEIYAQPELIKLDQTNQSELVFVEASAYLANHDLPSAEKAVHAALEKYPSDTNYLAMCAQAFINYGKYTNALPLIRKQVELLPDSPGPLVNEGYALLQLNDYAGAIAPLSRALEMDTNNLSARLNRAIAYLQSGQLDAAQQDYQILQKNYTSAYQVYYGLGEIAFRRKDTNTALLNYQLYLSNAPPRTEEAKQVEGRVQQLKTGSH